MRFGVPESPVSSTASYHSASSSSSLVYDNPIAMASQNPTPEQVTTVCEKFPTKEIMLPKWDGKKETYATFKFKLELKIEVLGPWLGSNKLICLGILECLPENKQNRVSSWLMRQGNTGMYDWREFLAFIHKQFDNRQAGLEAGVALTRMRQGDHQYFEDFLQDFEYKLSLCEGDSFGSAAKLILLHAAINDQTRDALIGNDITLAMGYEAYIDKVRLIASQIQARHKYRPKGTILQPKTVLVVGNTPQNQLVQPFEDHQIDGNGDTKMTGINAMAASSTNKALTSNGVERIKPPAPWRSQTEFKNLVKRGCCVRCAKVGHGGRRCPTYSPAIRPDKVEVSCIEELDDLRSESGKGQP